MRAPFTSKRRAKYLSASRSIALALPPDVIKRSARSRPEDAGTDPSISVK
jgi:hypothetical protein